MLPNIDNADVIFVAGDFEDDMFFEEEDAIAILANYKQVRNYLHKKRHGSLHSWKLLLLPLPAPTINSLHSIGVTSLWSICQHW